jgi:hypothetical protein
MCSRMGCSDICCEASPLITDMEISQFVSLIIGLTKMPPLQRPRQAVGGFSPQPQQTVSVHKRVTIRHWKIIPEPPLFGCSLAILLLRNSRTLALSSAINDGANEGTKRQTTARHKESTVRLKKAKRWKILQKRAQIASDKFRG